MNLSPAMMEDRPSDTPPVVDWEAIEGAAHLPDAATVIIPAAVVRAMCRERSDLLAAGAELVAAVERAQVELAAALDFLRDA